MKNAVKTPSTTPATSLPPKQHSGRLSAFSGIAMGMFLLITGCQKERASEQANPTEQNGLQTVATGVKYSDANLQPQTLEELKAARSATAKYQNIKNAFTDGYADIDVVRENMGYHFLKSTLLDTQFDPTRPEILVYSKKKNGQMELVALEYAVPISLMPDSPPEGFTGSSDVWKYDTEFGLWLLHAWVWEYNPDGIFKPNNPLVHLH